MKKLETNILASGEVTNHHHRANGKGVELYDREDGGTLLMKAPNGATVTHEEHSAMDVPADNYVRKLVQEQDHAAEEARQVRD